MVTLDKPRNRIALGPISGNDAYPLELFCQISGLSTHAMRIARRNGLVVHYVGNRGFVRGSDFLEFLAKAKKQK